MKNNLKNFLNLIQKNMTNNSKTLFEKYEWLEIFCWETTKKYFEKIFEKILKWFHEKFETIKIFWFKQSLNFEFRYKKNWQIIFIWIVSKKENYNDEYSTKNLQFNFDRQVDIDDFKKFLVWFKIKANDLNIEDFLKILEKDDTFKKKYFEKIFEYDRIVSIINDRWHPIHKFRFLVLELIFRNIDQKMNLDCSKIELQHSERECFCNDPHVDNWWYRFFNTPSGYYRKYNFKYSYLNENQKNEIKKDNYSKMFHTDLDDDDVVKWANDKLQAVVDEAIKIWEERELDIIAFNCCCVPRIIWEDIHSILKKWAQKSKTHFMLRWQLEKTPFEQKITIINKNIEKYKNSWIIKNSISLFWFEEDLWTYELVKHLQMLWIKVNSIFCPTINLKLISELMKSSLFVFNSNIFYNELFENFYKLWIEYITLDQPFWFEQSKNWIISILNKLWYKDWEWKLKDKIKNLQLQYEKKVEYVKENNFSLWFIWIWSVDLKKLFDKNYMSDIDITKITTDMWFNRKFAIFDWLDKYLSHDKSNFYSNDKKKTIEYLEQNNSIKWKYSLDFFSDENWMIKWNEEQKPNCIYSDIYFDDRLLKMWKSEFSVNYFEKWFEWIIRTIDNFIKLSNFDTYKKLQKYLIN